MSRQINRHAAVSDISTYCLQCDYTLNHFIVVKYWSLSWNEIISCGPSPEELGRLGLSQGDLSGLIVSCVYAHSVLTPHARQSKARLRGLFWMNSLAGPRRTGTCLLSAATHSRFCPPPQSYDHAHLAKWSGKQSWVYPKHKRQDSHVVFRSFWVCRCVWPWWRLHFPLRRLA